MQNLMSETLEFPFHSESFAIFGYFYVAFIKFSNLIKEKSYYILFLRNVFDSNDFIPNPYGFFETQTNQ